MTAKLTCYWSHIIDPDNVIVIIISITSPKSYLSSS